jgi:Gram-negative bacterial TonB protein C-terminal
MCGRIAVTLVVALAFFSVSARGDSSPSPHDLFSKALSQQDIWAKDTPPMKIRAEVSLQPEQGPAIVGAYQLDWISASQWREELRFSNYARGRIRVDGGYLQKSDTDYQPYFVFRFDHLLRVAESLSMGSKQSFGKVRPRETGNLGQACVETKQESHVIRTVCFDPKTGSMLSVDYPAYENQHVPYIGRMEYSDFRPYQGKLFPFEMRALRSGQPFITVKILEIGAPPEENSGIYKSRPDWTFWARCESEVGGLKRRVDPIIPLDTGRHREGGDVYFYAVVETDGSLSHVILIKGATERLDQAAGVAVRQWIYAPKVCDGKPVRRELEIDVGFWPRD